MSTRYSQAFYDRAAEISSRSAQRVVPHVMRMLSPGSVVDVGCGLGTWLHTFVEAGVGTALGIDGDYVDRSQMRIDPSCFVARDLEQPIETPEGSPDRFDLAVSMEVAEHLPPRCAPGFVESLTSLAPAVLFSAAVPHQGGTYHVNEQWPEYWAKLFGKRGYVTVDCIRSLVWDDPDVAYYYAQNALLYVEPALVERHDLGASVIDPADGTLARIHPRVWHEVHDPRSSSLKNTLRRLPWAAINGLRPSRARRAG